MPRLFVLRDSEWIFDLIQVLIGPPMRLARVRLASDIICVEFFGHLHRVVATVAAFHLFIADYPNLVALIRAGAFFLNHVSYRLNGGVLRVWWIFSRSYIVFGHFQYGWSNLFWNTQFSAALDATYVHLFFSLASARRNWAGPAEHLAVDLVHALVRNKSLIRWQRWVTRLLADICLFPGVKSHLLGRRFCLVVLWLVTAQQGSGVLFFNLLDIWVSLRDCVDDQPLL